jgi:hypothetical protein
MELNIQKTKLELIQWLTNLEDKAVLKKLLDISQEKTASYKLTEEERKSILKGLEDLKNGDVVSHSEVKKSYEKWL